MKTRRNDSASSKLVYTIVIYLCNLFIYYRRCNHVIDKDFFFNIILHLTRVEKKDI